jgi:hypothetical protein
MPILPLLQAMSPEAERDDTDAPQRQETAAAEPASRCIAVE